MNSSSDSESIDIRSNDSDDIEVVSVHVSHSAPREPLSAERAFVWAEVSKDDAITPESLRAALSKYEVLATDEQIQDMLHLVSRDGNPGINQFIRMLDTIVRKT